MSIRPFLVAIGNAVLPGIGYVVLKERVIFGWLLLASALVYIPFALLEPQANQLLLSYSPIGKFFEILTYLIASIAFGYDAYSLARQEEQVHGEKEEAPTGV